MMTVWMLVGAAVIAVVCALVLRQTHPAFSAVLTVAAGVGLFAAAVATALPAFERVVSLLEQGGVEGPYAQVLFKALGISLLSQGAADVCRDAGESALASKVEFGGKVLLLLCGLPLLEQAVAMLQSVIGGEAVIS